MYYLQYGPTKSRKFPTILGAKRHRWEFANRVRPRFIRLKEDGFLIATYYYAHGIGWVPGRLYGRIDP